MKTIRVIHIPFTKRNPYQKLLCSELESLDCSIKKVKTRKLYFLNITILYTLLVHWKPDIVHLHWHHSSLIEISKLKSIIKSIFFLFQILILKILRIKFVWTVHNLTHHENRNNGIELFFCRYIGLLSNAIITHCKTAIYEISKAYKIKCKEKIYVVPHGNYIKYYKNNISSKKAKKYFMFPTESIVFLVLGELRPYKGIKELICEFKKLKFEFDQLPYLMIAGRPKSENFGNALKKMVKGKKNIVLVLNNIQEKDMQIYFNAADIVVFPYRKVLTSGAILLAMSYKKPIIGPRLGCIQDVLHSYGGFLYNIKDKNGLSNALKDAILYKFKFERMGAYNFDQAEKLSWENIGFATYNIYWKLLKK